MSPPGGLDGYLDRIGRERLLGRAEEAALARRYRERRDPRDRQRLVAANLRFVVAVARRYRNRGLPLEDLVSEGNVGLLRAAERFDADRGVRFVTYAAWWIRQSILAALARARKAEGGEAGAVPHRRPRPHLSLQAPRGDRTGPGALDELIADESAERPDAPLGRAELRRAVAAGLAFLPEREARVLRLYYGLDGRSPRSLAAVGRELGVSRERARQLRSRGLDLLRRGPRKEQLRTLVG